MAANPEASRNGGATATRELQSTAMVDALALNQAATSDELNQLKGQFLASLNHEIRTPLSGVLGMTDLLLETQLDTEQHEYVVTARECAGQLLDTLNSILEYSAIAAGNIEVQQEEFHLRQVIESVMDDARTRAASKNLKLQYQHCPTLPETVFGDPRHLKQVLTQLVRNAVKFTQRGKVEIRSEFENGLSQTGRRSDFVLRLEVADTGIGIAAGKLRMIFESFRQLESGLARSYTGLGLGLAIADRLVGAMQGNISVKSEPGIGSVFTLRIPLGMPLVAAQDPTPNDSARRYRLLVVEDNKIAQQVITHLLRRNQYEVDCADHGQAGIDAASRRNYDLILMDLQMPGVDGLTATDEIRKLPAYQTVPILALTANYSDEYRHLCQRHGMQGFLFKPIQKEDVLATLRRHLP